MRLLLLLLSFSLVFFAACSDDEDQVTSRGPFDTYDTDEDIDAPTVACADAFDLYTYSNQPSPTAERISGISLNGAGVGLATVPDLSLWRVTNDGESWEKLNDYPNGNFLYLPFFADEETVYLIKSVDNNAEVVLLRSDDQGDSFQEFSIRGVFSIVDLHFDDPANGLIIANIARPSETPDYQLLTTTDGGMTWTGVVLPVGIGNANFLTVEGRLAINTRSSLLVRVPDTGVWEARIYPELFACCPKTIVFNGGNQGIAASNNQIFITSDAGRTWITDDVIYGRPELIDLRSDGTAMMVFHRYTVFGGDALFFRGLLIYESNDAGATWTIEKTDGGCGFGRDIFTTESGRIISTSREDLVFLD